MPVGDTCGCDQCCQARALRHLEAQVATQARRLGELRSERDRLAGRLVAVEAENIELRRKPADEPKAGPNAYLAPPKPDRGRRPTVTLITADGVSVCVPETRTVAIDF